MPAFIVIRGAAILAVVSASSAWADPVQARCRAEALPAAVARQRLEWARQCGTRINVRSPTSPAPPALMYDTGIIAADGVTHLFEYIETDDFWGQNSYSGATADVNGTFTRSQWYTGAMTATLDARGFQRWTEPAGLGLLRPSYPVFGDHFDITGATPLYPHPDYSLGDCSLYLDAAGIRRADTRATGFYVHAYCEASDVLGGRCADGTQEQVFGGGMVGCAGAVAFADRTTLCAPGFRVVTAAEWTALRGAAPPLHDYWTDNDLKYGGTGTAACSVSLEAGFSCGGSPMRVCTAGGADPEGNQCNWQHCGLDANGPDQFFGGCVGNISAGALCIVGGCADGSIEQTFTAGMVGCAGNETFAGRASLCGPGYRLATAAEWVARRGGAVPSHDYWTNDALRYSGAGPGVCSVSRTSGNDCGATPMRVCTASGGDPEGNQCNWQHCGLDANAPDQFFGGCVGNITAGALCVPRVGCADGSVEQTFAGSMVGCAGSETFANRANLCGPGYRLATAAEWTALRAGAAPGHDYWTSDALKFGGTASASCFASLTSGADCGATPMRVCTAGGSDPEGNQCNWQHCGLDANAPDQFFGGCVGNITAGALCVSNQGCADGSAEQVFANGVVGCAGAVTFPDRARLCAPGYRPATAAQWVTSRGPAVPAHDYWTDDALRWSGTATACFVSTTAGSDSCGSSPMRVCTPTGSDPEGNGCNWTHCGLDASTPDQFFGGCLSNAGTLCAPM